MVQGIVTAEQGLPMVQFQQVGDDGEIQGQWESDPFGAREMAQQIIEATMNAVYDAALVAWAKETWPDDPDMGWRMLKLIRDYRADVWGLPDQPEDWRTP